MFFCRGEKSKNRQEVKKIVKTSLENDFTIIAQCDEYLNVFFGGSTVKIIRIVTDLTKALEELITKFAIVETKNAKFRNEIDRLQAMLKVRSGKFVEYQKRVNELNDLGMQLTKEAIELKSTFDTSETNKAVNFSHSHKKIFALNKLMKILQSKLNNDYEALITAGNPGFSEYLQRITGLNVFCRSLQEELRRLETVFRLSPELKNKDRTIIFQEVHHLQKLINGVKIEIEKLRSTPLRDGCRIGGDDSNQYLHQVLILIEIVEKSKIIVTDLESSIGTNEGSCEEKIHELELVSKRLQFGIKKLETSVASGDNSSLIKRIEELENSIFHLEHELAEKEDSEMCLQRELTGAKILFRHKCRDLKLTKSKVQSVKHESRRKDEEIKKLLDRLETRTPSIFDQRFHARIKHFEIIRKSVEHIRFTKDQLSEKMDEIRNFLLERTNEISRVLRGKSAVEDELKAELEELKKENAQLKSSMQLVKKKKKKKKGEKRETSGSDKQVKECGNSGPEDLIENVEKESRNLKVSLKNTNDDPETINVLKNGGRNFNGEETEEDRTGSQKEVTSYEEEITEETKNKETNEKAIKLETISEEMINKVTSEETLNEKENVSKVENESKEEDTSNEVKSNKKTPIKEDTKTIWTERGKTSNEEATICNEKLKLNKTMTMGDQLIADLEVEETRSKTESSQTLEKLSRERDELEEKMKILKDENESLSRRYGDAVEECSICRNQLESLRKEAFRHHQAKYDDSSVRRTKMSRLTEDKLLATRKGFEAAANLRKTSSSLAEDLKLIVFRDEVDLDKENDRLRLELKETQIERQQLVMELSQWKEASRLDETHLKTGTRTPANVQVEEKMQVLKKENLSLHEKSRHLESQLFLLREQVDELAKSDVNLKTEKEKLENDLENLKRELDLSKTGNEKCQIEFERQRSDDEKYSESEKQITSQKLEAENTLRNLIQRTNRVENDSAHETRHESRVQSGENLGTKDVKYVKILEIELTRTQDENEKLKNQLEQLGNNIQSLKDERTKLKCANDEITSISEIHQEINVILKQQLANFMKENEKLEITKMKLHDLDPKLQRFYKDYVVLKKSLQAALEEIHSLKEYNANLIKMQNFLDNC